MHFSVLKSNLSKALVSLVLLVSVDSYGQSLEFVGCDSSEKSRIRSQMRWIRTQSSAIVHGVDRRHPDAWRGRSKKRFQSTLYRGVIRVECTRDPQICTAPKQEVFWRNTGYPAPHRYPLTLCMDLLIETEALTSVLIHLLGHEVLLSGHQTDCIKRCETPKLAELLTQVVQSLMTGEAFSLEWCLTACAPPRELDAETINPTSDAGTPLPATPTRSE